MDDCHGHRRNFSIYYFLAFIMTLIYKVLYSLLTLFLCLLATKHLLHIQLPTIINSYANDLLCMPIVLTICLIAVQKIKKDDSIRLSLFTIISLTLYYAIYFEYYQPQINPRYTSDGWDIVMYSLGSLFFYGLQKKSNLKKKP